jgi:hypothetical protein
LFTPLSTLTVEFSPHHSSSLLPPCLGHRRPPPPVLFRPHLLHLDHRPSLRDLNVRFNASLEPFSGLPPMTLPRPSTPSWRATLGEPPTAFCLKSESPSPRATLSHFPADQRWSVGRISPVSRWRRGGGISPPPPCFPGWAETAVRAGPCRAGTPFRSRLAWQAATRPVQQAVRSWATSGPRGWSYLKFSFRSYFWYSIIQKYSKNCKERITTPIKVKPILLDS